MNQKPARQSIWLPLVIAVAVVAGLLIGTRFSTSNYSANNDRKLNAILGMINQDYVDSTNLNDLIEMSIPEILRNLDPHSVYLTADELRASGEHRDSTLCSIGVSVEVINDTAGIVEVIPDGPSARVGIMAGDRIVTINDSATTGESITKGAVSQMLLGPKGSKVKLGIRRHNSSSTLTFTVTRGGIPANTVDVYYMLDKFTGYVKVNQFGRHTYDEFMKAMKSLESEGAKRYIIDLRGNGGGFMEMAVRMANEFLPDRQPIVFTKGRYKRDDGEAWSNGDGAFQDVELAILIDAYSASASEIFAGALQDNDRALIVGNRSFGKGLVQKDFILPDSSAIRLTTARYFTPSGRCIQKDYKSHRGDATAYDAEVAERYRHGEMDHADSIKVDESQRFTTRHGRTVYGGGGIVPDIFVPRDTTGITSYYINIENAGLLQRFSFDYCNSHRSSLSKMTDYKQFLRMAPSDDVLLDAFVDYAATAGIAPRWYYINMSRDLILNKIKALIARDAFGSRAYYPILNRSDNTVQQAIKALNKHKAVVPITQSLDPKSIAGRRNSPGSMLQRLINR